MLLRWAGPILIVGFWLGSMTWLVAHDLWPEWTAKEVPRMGLEDIPLHAMEPAQIGIYDESGHRVGGIWTSYTGHTDIFSRTDELRLDSVPVVRSLLVVSETDFDGDGMLRAFRVGLHLPDADFPINVDAERFNNRIAVAIRAGSYYQAMDLDGGKTAMISEMFRPFYRLPDLKVGQTWRMQVMDPIALVMQKNDPFVSMIVRVTGKRTVDHKGAPLECFVVETPQATALVAADGTVVEQQVRIPGFGLVTLRDEPYEQNQRDVALQLLPNRKAWRTREAIRENP